jgi:ArsR family transcriptional regulator
MLANAPILDRMAAVSDPIRCRMLRLVERHELTVSELCAVLQLPQSTVSRHLRTLLDDEWVTARRDGTSRYYSMGDDLAPDARGLWQLIRGQVAESAGASHDDARVERVLAGRRSKSREFFSSAAEEWDRLRADLFGDRLHLQALVGLIAGDWVVGDLGCGTGAMAQALAPFVRAVVAVDSSREMLSAAKARVEGLANVQVRPGDLEALPIADGELDAAVMMLVLHHVPEPARALGEAARVLKPGGRLLVVDMWPHDRAEYQQQMGHVWLGFSDKQMRRLLRTAGFEGIRLVPLPVDPAAQGPTLFAAGAHRVRNPKAETDRAPDETSVRLQQT